MRYGWSVTKDGRSMSAEDKDLDEIVRTVYCMAIGFILLGRALNTETDEHKDQKPRRKPKGRWRYKQYEEWDKK